MKQIIILFSILVATQVQADNKKSFMGWHPDIPATADKVLELIHVEAQYYSFDTDEGRCGGAVAQPQLMAHSSYGNDDGIEVHQVTISFQATKAVNYCETEATMTCVAQVDVFSKSGLVLNSFDCQE